MNTTYTSPNTGIAYDVEVKEEHADRCWLCKGTGTEAFETEADKVANELAYDEWEPENGDCDDAPPDEIMTGRRTCTRCTGTGKVDQHVGAIRFTLKTSTGITMVPGGCDPNRSGILKFNLEE